MEMHHVVSSNLYAIGYGDNSLVIEFNSGGIYEYYGVPFEVFCELLNASSHGKYFSNFIKNRYPFSLITSQIVTAPKPVYVSLALSQV